MAKKALAVELSKLAGFSDPVMKLEQYPTNSEIAAEMLWMTDMKEGIENQHVIDLGAGTGVLGIGCLLLGAEKVTFIEKDEKALEDLRDNLDLIKETFEGLGTIEIIEKNVFHMAGIDSDVVVQNPPFGTKDEGKDILFLEKAFDCADTVLSFHKTSTKEYIREVSRNHRWHILIEKDYNFPLKNTLSFHDRDVENIKVTGYLFKD